MISRRSLLKYVALAPAMSAGLPLARATNRNACGKGRLHSSHRDRVGRTFSGAYRSRRPSTTVSFPVRSCASRKVGELRHRYPQRFGYAGTRALARTDDPERGRRRFRRRHALRARRTTCAACPSCRSRPGFRFYHTHVIAGGNLNRGTYTGQTGPVFHRTEEQSRSL